VAQSVAAAPDKEWAISGELHLDPNHSCHPEYRYTYGLISTCRNIVLTLLLCFVVTESQSEELELDWLWELPPPPKSSLGIHFGIDDADGWNHQLDLSLAGPLAIQLDLSFGESYVESEEAQLETDFRHLSLSSDPLAEVSGSIGYEAWGDEDALTIKSRWLGLTLNLGDLSITLMPQQRDIRLQVLPWFRRFVSHIDLESHDIGLSLTYFAPDGWIFSTSYFDYDYSKDVSRLNNNNRVIFIFPLNTLDLVSGLDQYRYSFAIGKLVDNIDIGLDWTRSRSAVDGNASTVTTLSGGFPLDDRFRLNLTTGMQDVDYTEEQIFFLNFGLTFSW
jgi:hypothetical protein